MGARLGTLAMPFSRGILLVRKEDAFCALAGHRRAHHSSEPACAAAAHFFFERQGGRLRRARTALWHTKQHAIERSVAELGGMLQLTFKLDALSSGTRSLMLNS